MKAVVAHFQDVSGEWLWWLLDPCDPNYLFHLNFKNIIYQVMLFQHFSYTWSFNSPEDCSEWCGKRFSLPTCPAVPVNASNHKTELRLCSISEFPLAKGTAAAASEPCSYFSVQIMEQVGLVLCWTPAILKCSDPWSFLWIALFVGKLKLRHWTLHLLSTLL